MQIHLTDNAELIEDLCLHYRRSGFTAERVGGGMVEVGRRDAPTSDQERREVIVHLAIWALIHPEAEAEPI